MGSNEHRREQDEIREVMSEAKRLARESAQYPSEWRGVGVDVMDDQERVVAFSPGSPTTAAYIAGLHNLFIRLHGTAVLLLKKVSDRKELTREIMREDKLRR